MKWFSQMQSHLILSLYNTQDDTMAITTSATPIALSRAGLCCMAALSVGSSGAGLRVMAALPLPLPIVAFTGLLKSM